MRRRTIGDRIGHAGPNGVAVRIRHGTAFHERTNLLVQTFPGIRVESQTANLFLRGARKIKNVRSHPLVRHKRNEKLGALLHTLRIVELGNIGNETLQKVGMRGSTEGTLIAKDFYERCGKRLTFSRLGSNDTLNENGARLRRRDVQIGSRRTEVLLRVQTSFSSLGKSIRRSANPLRLNVRLQ